MSSLTPPKADAVIVAAGGARRMGFDKLAAPLAGLPVLVRTVQAFLASPVIARVIVATSEERWQLLADYGLAEQCLLVSGGSERHHSVCSGLRQCTADFVAVHDGARPMVSAEAILKTLTTAIEYGAAAVGRRVTDTLKRADARGQVTGSVDREGLWAMETPQCFRTDLLRQAYEAVLAQNLIVTDEVSALQVLGYPVHLVEHSSPNLKITYPDDFALAEKLIKHADSFPKMTGRNSP